MFGTWAYRNDDFHDSSYFLAAVAYLSAAVCSVYELRSEPFQTSAVLWLFEMLYLGYTYATSVVCRYGAGDVFLLIRVSDHILSRRIDFDGRKVRLMSYVVVLLVVVLEHFAHGHVYLRWRQNRDVLDPPPSPSPDPLPPSWSYDYGTQDSEYIPPPPWLSLGMKKP